MLACTLVPRKACRSSYSCCCCQRSAVGGSCSGRSVRLIGHTCMARGCRHTAGQQVTPQAHHGVMATWHGPHGAMQRQHTPGSTRPRSSRIGARQPGSNDVSTNCGFNKRLAAGFHSKPRLRLYHNVSVQIQRLASYDEVLLSMIIASLHAYYSMHSSTRQPAAPRWDAPGHAPRFAPHAEQVAAGRPRGAPSRHGCRGGTLQPDLGARRRCGRMHLGGSYERRSTAAWSRMASHHAWPTGHGPRVASAAHLVHLVRLAGARLVRLEQVGQRRHAWHAQGRAGHERVGGGDDRGHRGPHACMHGRQL